jgi:type 1 glutamine amidotransferase
MTVVVGSATLTAGETEKLKVLIVDGQNNHAWQQTTPHMKKWLESSGRFQVDVATSPAKPRKPAEPKAPNAETKAKYQEELARFQKLQAEYELALAKFNPPFHEYHAVLSNYNGDNWSADARAALERYVAEGKGGLVIVHAANNSFSNWKEYDLMIGMGWRGAGYGDRMTLDANGAEKRVAKGQGPGAGHGPQHEFLIVLRDRKHPVTDGMPAEWLHCQDELYHGMRGPIQNIHLLATAHSAKAKGGTGEHEPMIWTVAYGKGRVFHTPMGHDLKGMRCLGFIATLQRGTEWAATGKVTIPLPQSFPGPDKSSSVSEK